MPTTDSVTIVLRAVNEASAALNDARRQLDQFTQTQDRATGSGERFNRTTGETDRQTRRLHNTISNLTSGAGLTATALTRVQGVLFSIPFGLVTGAVAGLTAALSTQVIKWLDLESAASRAQKALADFSRTADQQVQQSLLRVQTRIEELDAFWSRVTSLSRFKILAEVIRDLGVSASPTQINEEVIRRLEDKWRALKAEFEAIRVAPVSVPEAIQRGRFAAQGLGGVAREIGEARASGNAERQDRLNEAIKTGGVVLIEYNAALERNADSAAEWSRIQSDAANQVAIAHRILAEQAAALGRTGQGFLEDVTRQPTEEIFAEHERRMTAVLLAEAQTRKQIRDWEAADELAVITGVVAQKEALRQREAIAQQGMLTVAGTILNSVKSQSRAIFLLNKALAVASTIVYANMAATAAAASAAILGPEAAIAAGETVRRWGYANAALIAATALAEGFSGAFGGGGGGGGGSSSPGPTSAREIGPTASAQPVNITIQFHSTVTDRASVESFFNDNAHVIGEIVRERSGQMGPVTLTYE